METKLTPLFLKTVAQKFDLETIFILDVSDKNIQGNVGNLGDCLNLMNVDISRNRITMLTGMESLVNLKICNLSYNKLTSIDGIKGCTSLERLDLQGNLIKDIKAIERVAPSLTKLVNLYMQEFNGEGANPVCWQKVYRSGIKQFWPNLSSLDG